MKQQKTKTNEQILDAILDLAEDNGMEIDDYIKKLQAEVETASVSGREGLSEDILAELENAKTLKKQNREAQKQSKKSESIKSEVEKFKTIFPDAAPQDIPESVWEEVANGVSLIHAYALYLVTENKDSLYANEINSENASRATSKTSDGETEPAYTKEQVESMSPKEVSKNYKHILKSISKWKL